jgi:hypothetical protein
MPSTQLVKYQTDAGTIVRVRIGAGAAAVAGNTEPAGAIDDGRIFAYASKAGNRRGGQLNARGLLERFTGTGINRKRFTTFVPILTPAALGTFTEGAELTINTVLYKIATKIGEA